MNPLRDMVRTLQPFLQVTGRCSEAVARQSLEAIRTPDMEMVRRVSRETGTPADVVDLVWCRMVDAIVAQEKD